ncbi:MAG: HEAT repeat protein [Myxococcota bacterium]
MRRLVYRFLATGFVLALSTSAFAASHFFFAPVEVDFGGGAQEIYAAATFDAKGQTGTALADASLKELGNAFSDAKQITVTFKGPAAALTIADDKKGDAAIADRALGAVYHTLMGAGVTSVSLDGTKLRGDFFSRGAHNAVVPLVAALPPKRVGGFVQVDKNLVPSTTFYERLASGDSSIQAAVVKLLGSATESVKLSLLETLVTFKFKDVTGVILPRLKDPSEAVRLGALARLGGNKAKPVITALERTVNTDASGAVKLAAVRLLVKAGKTQYSRFLLVDKLASGDVNVILDAVKGLVATKDPKMAPSIGELATHGNPQVRTAALTAIGEMGAYPVLQSWLSVDDVPADTKEAAAKLLAQKGSTVTFQAAGLSWLLRSGTPEAAVYAAQFVDDKRVTGVTDALGAALARPEKEVRSASAIALGALKDTAGLEALATAFRASKDSAEKELLTQQATSIISVQPVSQVIKIAESTDQTIKELAIKSLSAFDKDKKAAAVLQSALKDKTPAIRQAAAYAVARLSDPAAKAKLLKLADDKDAAIRAQVAYAAGRLTDSASQATLIKYLDDRDALVKASTIEGVRMRGLKAGLDKIKWLASNRTVEVRREAIHAMVVLSEPATPDYLKIYIKAMLDADDAVRVHAISGLAAYVMDGAAAQAIGTPLTDASTSSVVKLKALEALAGMEHPDAVENAVRGLFDRDRAVKFATLKALESLKSDKASRPLQEFILSESDAEVKARAEQVLDTL